MLIQLAIARFRSLFAVGMLGLFLGFGVPWSVLTAGAQEYHTIIFNAPGADKNPGDYNGSYPSSINAWGTITGSYQDVNSVFHGFVRSRRGAFTTFQAPWADTNPYNGTSPSSINDLGAITGSYADAHGVSHGFLRGSEGNFTTFDPPGADGYGSFPVSINIEGAIVGYYFDSNYLFHAFQRSPNGSFTTWVGPGSCDTSPAQGCYGSGASSINGFGIIAGGYEDNSGNFVHHNYVRTPDGELTTFDVPGAGIGSYQGSGCPGCVLGLNQWGAIAGTYIDANSVQHGFVRSPYGKFTTFDAPGAGIRSGEGTGCPSDCPTSLNDWGAITGTYIDAITYHGYLRTPDGKFATIDPQGSTFTWTVGINDWGEITGYYLDANNVYHGFVRIPDR